MKVWDVFPYWREQWAVDARLQLWNALAPEVEYVPVALLGDRTHRGAPLPRATPAGVQSVTVRLDAGGDWEREKQQRDAIWLLHPRMAPDDVVLLCDADELTDPRVLPQIVAGTEQGLVKLRMAMYCCGTRWRHGGWWRHPGACRARDLPERPSDQLRHHFAPPKIEAAGWHLSYYGTDADIDAKLSAFAHAEVDTPEMREQLADLRDNGGQGFVDEPLTGPLADILAGIEVGA